MKKPPDKRPSLAALQSQIMAGAPAGWRPDDSKFPLAFMSEKARPPRKEGVKNKTPEADSQAEIVSYLRRCCPSVIVAASLNGELRPTGDMGKFYGWIAKLKARGMLSGDPDLRLTWYPSRCIFIEKKRAKGGRTSEAQDDVGARLRAQGFPVYVLEGGIDELREIIKKENIPCMER